MTRIPKKKILAVIPARGGSKGVPGKNTKRLAGKPLILHTIEAALESKHLDKIVVSTDDQDIARVAKKAGVQVIERPVRLAQDNTPMHPVIEHAAAHIDKTEHYTPEVIVVLQPTSPLRTAKDIDQAIELFLNSSGDSLVSVMEASHPIHWTFKMSGEYVVPRLGRKYLKVRRQDLEKSYVPVGAIFIVSPETLFKSKDLYGKKIVPYIMPHERSIDIDHLLDFAVAELLIKQNQKS
jgi:CMP-N,N'-diacetyllegionaminic acid synthase